MQRDSNVYDYALTLAGILRWLNVWRLPKENTDKKTAKILAVSNRPKLGCQNFSSTSDIGTLQVDSLLWQVRTCSAKKVVPGVGLFQFSFGHLA